MSIASDKRYPQLQADFNMENESADYELAYYQAEDDDLLERLQSVADHFNQSAKLVLSQVICKDPDQISRHARYWIIALQNVIHFHFDIFTAFIDQVSQRPHDKDLLARTREAWTQLDQLTDDFPSHVTSLQAPESIWQSVFTCALEACRHLEDEANLPKSFDESVEWVLQCVRKTGYRRGCATPVSVFIQWQGGTFGMGFGHIQYYHESQRMSQVWEHIEKERYRVFEKPRRYQQLRPSSGSVKVDLGNIRSGSYIIMEETDGTIRLRPYEAFHIGCLLYGHERDRAEVESQALQHSRWVICPED